MTASAPWKHSDLPMTVVYDDKMWLMGGWYNGRLPGHEASHEVWSSVDGSKWTAATRIAEWSPRLAAGVLAFKGQMWILGGTESYYFGDQKSLKNDVWATSDGAHWKLVTEHAGWSPRAYHAAVVHDGKMWVMGRRQFTMPQLPPLTQRRVVFGGLEGQMDPRARGGSVAGSTLVFRSRLSRSHVGLGRLVQ